VTWLPALTCVSVCVRPLPCSLPFALLTLAETLMNRKKVRAWLKVFPSALDQTWEMPVIIRW
ncbi:hypothetical protein ACCW71_20350, partial [Pantoea sp. C2G6]